MKKILILTIGLFAVACGPSKEEMEAKEKLIIESSNKHKIGDIVYIKPDSSKAVIVNFDIDFENCYCEKDNDKYKLKYEVRDIKGNTLFISQELIYPVIAKSDYE